MTPFLHRILPWLLFFVVYMAVGLVMGRLDLPMWTNWVRYAVAGAAVVWLMERQQTKKTDKGKESGGH